MTHRIVDPYSDAISEAYTLAPSTDRILHTLELRHSSLIGNVAGAIRVVRDYGLLLHPGAPGEPDLRGFFMLLEEDPITAPLNTGENVVFQACMFDFTPPEQQQHPPSFEISIDNVSSLIVPYLDDVAASGDEIAITYREYLYLAPLAGPQYILAGGHIQAIRSTSTRVSATVAFSDLVNVNFPAKVYRPEEFPSLSP